MEKIIEEHKQGEALTVASKIENTKNYKRLNAVILDTTHLVNLNDLEHLELMFYNSKVLSAEWGMTKDSLKYFLDLGYNITTTMESSDSLQEFRDYPNFNIIPYPIVIIN